MIDRKIYTCIWESRLNRPDRNYGFGTGFLVACLFLCGLHVSTLFFLFFVFSLQLMESKIEMGDGYELGLTN